MGQPHFEFISPEDAGVDAEALDREEIEDGIHHDTIRMV